MKKIIFLFAIFAFSHAAADPANEKRATEMAERSAVAADKRLEPKTLQSRQKMKAESGSRNKADPAHEKAKKKAEPTVEDNDEESPDIEHEDID